LALDHLRQGISLRAYAQRDPLNEYKSEAFTLFEEMLVRLREQVTTTLAHLELRFRQGESEPSEEAAPQGTNGSQPARPERPRMRSAAAAAAAVNPGDPATWGKVSRNQPCPCGSGKKFKQCHGKLGAGAAAAS
jgi:preprotein translocase subunit SecA